MHLKRVVKGVIPCLFLGKSAQVFPLKFKKGGYPSANSYPLEHFENPNLEYALKEVDEELGIPYEANSLYQLPVGYVHVYSTKTVSCSALKLTAAAAFFTFESTPVESLPPACTLDLKPFVYAKDDLKRVSEDTTEYAWKTEECVSWDWNEEVWSQRLYQCIQQVEGVKVVPAFLWKPNGYKADISTIFSKVKCIRATPFHGMTDILLIGEKSLGLIRVQEMTVVCSVEVGTAKDGTCAVTIAGEVKIWPDKLGELLASMCFFGTLNYLNNLLKMPDKISFETYGVLAIRSIGCIVIQMVVDHTGSHIRLIHEGGVLSLGSAIEYVLAKLKTSTA